MSSLMNFSDRLIPYETFLNDVAARVVSYIKSDKDDPEFVSQRRAYEIFGRRNVERWRRVGFIKPYKRPGRLEYKMADLRYLQRQYNDYYDK